MAVFPDRIVLKNSTDNQSVITDAIRSGGSDAITQGEIVLGLESGDTKLYTVDANGDIIVISTSSAAGRMIISTTEPTVGIGNLPLANGDTWYNPDPAVETIYVYSGGAWLGASSGSPGANELNELTDVSLSTTINNDEVLVYTGSSWTNRPNVVTWPMTTAGDMAYYAAPTIDDPAGPQRLPIGLTGQVLTVVDGSPTWASAGVESIGVGDLQDVDLTLPSKPLLDGSVLVYDEVASTWYPGSTDGLGTVTYVGIETPDDDILVLGGPITDAGTFALSLPIQPAFGANTYPAAKVTVNGKGIITDMATSSSGDLSDVDLSVAPTENQVLVWNETDGAWKPGDQTGGGGDPGTIASIDDIGDVDTSTDPPVNGEVLTWDNDAGLWVASAPTGGAQVISDLTDVSDEAPSDGQVLTWRTGTSDWGPAPAGSGTVTSVDGVGTNGVDVTGGPIVDSGTLTVSLSNTGVNAGSYDGANLTVDAQGRITNISNGFSDPLTTDGDMVVRISGVSARLGAGTQGQVLSIDSNGLPAWDIIPSEAGGTVTSVDVAGGAGLSSSGGPVIDSGVITLDLTNTGVVAGDYNMAAITVDVNGRITSASDGDLSQYSLSDLGDVDTVTSPPTNNQVLLWDAANSRWIADDSPGVEAVDKIVGGTFGSGL